MFALATAKIAEKAFRRAVVVDNDLTNLVRSLRQPLSPSVVIKIAPRWGITNCCEINGEGNLISANTQI
jgi:hypothetical protein